MPRMPEIEDKHLHKSYDHRVYVLPCDCEDSHYLKIIWDNEDPKWRWVTIEDTLNCYYTPWKMRFQRIWSILRRGTVCSSEVVLTDTHIKSLRDFLNDIPIPSSGEES